MKEYFEAEMRLLQDAAQEFAEAYPEQAAMLNLNAVKDRDPYVERLLEGMAFLTAKVRERIDDGVPELSENLLDQINPSLCRPYPSYTLVQFSPSRQHKKTIEISKGTNLAASGVGPEEVRCEYVTTSVLKVQPLVITHASAMDKLGGGTRVQIDIQKLSNFEWEDLELTDLLLHLHCDHALAYALYECLTNVKGEASVSVEGGSFVGRLTVRPALLRPYDSLLPSGSRGHVAFNLLHDYFNARDKFLFIDIDGFQPESWPQSANSIKLLIETPTALPAGHNIGKDTFQLNCIPAVNLFDAQTEPVVVNGKLPDYPLLVDHSYRNCANVYSVQHVVGRNPQTGHTREYQPLQNLTYRRASDPTYSTYNRNMPNGKRRSFISVSGHTAIATEILSVDVLASNEDYPRQYLDIGKLKELASDIDQNLEVRNITRPSRMLRAPDIHDYQWQLISLMSLTLSSLGEVDKLKTLLSLFDWSDQEENKNRILAIEKVDVQLKHKVTKGILCQGLEISLEINESGFSSRSDIYLFGTVLHQFFSDYANITEYVETRVTALPSYKEWTWKPNIGRRLII
ncbi:type VI secretion system baseplate subunit TssF [Gynuella sunshinyii]|uniref:Type VI secretion protein, VC_A0110 family n=1 Tax=Gynuella sunshinyii YC6258 TaxID=1445510 RepID=A0A0C5VGV5_9GAMM|nr:type VI secretion system baseplate subunit TssF [Gynuella sunshinyii]AJQ93827.1 hypothetical protein YC6258_01783 [Gynuella sunshinyii YC6258]